MCGHAHTYANMLMLLQNYEFVVRMECSCAFMQSDGSYILLA